MEEDKKYVLVKKLIDEFRLIQLTGDEESLQRKIYIADTNRPGLELAGYFEHTQKERIIVLGDKELKYIKTLSTVDAYRSFNFITNDTVPVIIIPKLRECPPELMKIAEDKNFPILHSRLSTTQLIVSLVTFLDEKLAPMQGFHGELVSMYGKGVLILGESGIGKSEVTMELMRRGHQLVADDRVEVYQMHNHLVGKPPKLLQGFLEVRGIGIIDVERLFGMGTVLKNTQVDVVVQLKPWESNEDYDRVGIEDLKNYKILDLEVPLITLPVRAGRSMAYVIEAAVTNMILKESGYDSAKEFERRCVASIEEKKEAK